MKTRIAVFVSGGGTNLQALINAEKAGIIHSGTIVLVISSSPSAYALQRAEKAGIDTAVISRRIAGSQEKAEEQMLECLSEHKVDMIVLAGYMNILTENFIRHFPNRILNVHPSLIPSFCGKGFYGLKVHEEALKRGVKVTGATVHYVNEIPDGGEIIFQKAVEVCPGDTPEILQKRVMEQAEWKLLPAAAELTAKRLLDEKTAAEQM